MQSLTKHMSHYFSLIGILIFGVLAFVFFSGDKLFLTGVSIAIAVSYVVWGIIHHLIHKDLYLSVIIEYIAVATLGLIVVLSLIFRL